MGTRRQQSETERTKIARKKLVDAITSKLVVLVLRGLLFILLKIERKRYKK